MSDNEMGGFDFTSIKPMTVKEAAKAMGQAMGKHQVFEINTEGTVKIHGYAVDEAIKLLVAYREHMIEFGRGMQDLAGSMDAVTYRPGDGGYS